MSNRIAEYEAELARRLSRDPGAACRDRIRELEKDVETWRLSYWIAAQAACCGCDKVLEEARELRREADLLAAGAAARIALLQARVAELEGEAESCPT